MGLFDRILRTGEGKMLRSLQSLVPDINAVEPELERLDDDALRHRTVEFRERLDRGEDLDDLLIEAFAVVREASRRVIGQRHYDVQLMGGAALHFGWVAEMKTGEGKTLVSTLPVYLNGLTGKGVHLVTVNDYLARRDAEWMGQIHGWLGLSVGLIVPGLDDHAYKKAQYAADLTYGTNNEFGFDYLRDNMAMAREQQVQRGHVYAIVDEIDSILIDEARTPLIISGRASDAAPLYLRFADVVRRLRKGVDYEVDEEKRQVAVNDSGIEKVEVELADLGVENLYDVAQTNLVHQLYVALKAKELFHRDKDYIVTQGEVKIVDEFTGRTLEGRRWSEGIHQAVEAKEGVKVKEENQTLATVTLQNYFRMYEKLAGMTGTAQTEASELAGTYNLQVVPIPTNRPMVREDNNDLIYKAEQAKFEAVVDDIVARYEVGQPVLAGTASVEHSERLSKHLRSRGVRHEVLNAKAHARESEIIAQAGRLGAVTVATNMAGRGVDILLGGNPELLALHQVRDRGFAAVGDWLVGLDDRIRRAEADGVPDTELKALEVLRERAQRAADRFDEPADVRAELERKGIDPAEAGLDRGFEVLTVDELRRRVIELERVLGSTASDGLAPEVVAALEVELVVSRARRECFEELRRLYEPECQAEGNKVREAGGLYVVGTERHESRRIDNQLRGRSGRQGDPGESRFYISLEDDLMRLFATGMMERVMSAAFPDDVPIESKMVTKAVERAQTTVEQRNAEIRKNVLKYDEVMNEQRKVVYAKRNQILDAADLREDAMSALAEAVDAAIEASCTSTVPDEWDLPGLLTEIGTYYPTRLTVDDLADFTQSDEIYDHVMGEATAYYERRERELGDEAMRELERMIMLNILDQHWREHLYEMDYLREGIGLRAMGQRDPLTEWQREGFDMFAQMMRSVAQNFVRYVMHTEVRRQLPAEPAAVEAATPAPAAAPTSAAARAPVPASAAAAASFAPAGAEGAAGGAPASPTGAASARPAAARAGAAGARTTGGGPAQPRVTNVSYTSSDGARPAPAPGAGGAGGTPSPTRQPAGGRQTRVAAPGPSRVTAGGGRSRAQRTVESPVGAGERPAGPGSAARSEDKVGRNDPCPCGSGKKFKQCHGRTPAGSATS